MNNLDNYFFGVISFTKGNEVIVKSKKEKILERDYIIGSDQLFFAPKIDRFIKLLFNNQIFIYKIFQRSEEQNNYLYHGYYIGRILNNQLIKNETFIPSLNQKVSLISIKELKIFDQDFSDNNLKIKNIAKTLDTKNQIDLNLNFFSFNNLLIGKKDSGKSNTIKNFYLSLFNQYLKNFNQTFHKFVFFDLKNQYFNFFKNNLNSFLLGQLKEINLKEKLLEKDSPFFNFKKLGRKEKAFLFDITNKEERYLLDNFFLWIEDVKQISFINIINKAILKQDGFVIIKNFLLNLVKISIKDQNLKFNHYLIILKEILDKLSLINDNFYLNDIYNQYYDLIEKENQQKIIFEKKGNNLIFEKEYFSTFLDLIREKYLNGDSNIIEKFNNFIASDWNSLLNLFQLQNIIDNNYQKIIFENFINKLNLKKDNENYLIVKQFALSLKNGEKRNSILDLLEKNNLIIFTFDNLSSKIEQRLIYLFIKLLTFDNCLDLPEEKKYLNIVLDDFDKWFKLSLIDKSLDLDLLEKLISQQEQYKTFFTISVENVNLLREKMFIDFDNFLIHNLLDQEEFELTTHYLKKINEHQIYQTFNFEDTELLLYGKSFKRVYPVKLINYNDKKIITNQSEKVIFNILNQKS
ncbi:hypothetical protein X271_00204 [Candidatus Hepatoplasma crinochetorum Av]|uniref:Helicase HerA central domain-containing protein n=1 Tax=Candidatus Hepatoplasma crinochetorum Av TaxID=1427984 RepID=W8GFD1_9MOLU|nr:hypothetical protein [Candidatus Hepatoplasma crinochetorum]AHK22313.1 hypothetical protein X271_00204 [Candidatus Hepatoplasma crinochetorum Av]